MGRFWSRLRPRNGNGPAPHEKFTAVQWLHESPWHDLWDPTSQAASPNGRNRADDAASVCDRVLAETEPGPERSAMPTLEPIVSTLEPPLSLLAPPSSSDRESRQKLLRRRMEATGRRLKNDIDDVDDLLATPRIAESDIRASMALHLAGEGFHIRRPETKSRRVFPSLAAFKAEHQWWVACRGYPGQAAGVSPLELARQWLALALLDVIGYHSADEAVELGLALPDVHAYHRLIDDVDWSLEALGITLWWVGDDGIVRADVQSSATLQDSTASRTE